MTYYEVNLWDSLIEVCYMGDLITTLDEAQAEFLAAWDYVYAQGDEHITPTLDVVEYDNQGFVGYA